MSDDIISTIYDGNLPTEIDPVLGFPRSVEFTTRKQNDFPGVTLTDPIVTDDSGKQHNLTPQQITAGEVKES